MQEFSIFHWVAILAIVLILWFGKEIREVLRHLVEGPRGGPPTHPVPVTGPVETSRPSKSAEEARKP
jgi:hypothetical protein